MIAEFGVICLVCCLLLSALQFSAIFIPVVKKYTTASLSLNALLQALMCTLSLASLMILRVSSDFSVENVAANSNLSLPTLYKLVGTWGNHEGSMLLWVWVLAMFGTMLALNKTHNQDVIFSAVSIQSGLIFGTVAFLLFTSNPFSRLFPPPYDGKALNPLLQDIGLAIHPPLLYGGYVGFSIVFSLAVAALITRIANQEWAKLTHNWILFAWSSLTIGIGLGSWWAYRELGWGGWWFWDPVENASLLPWLAGTALLHSNSVLKKRNMLASWVILLAILTFALSMIGTFLVRSGALISVHSFASDPTRGFFILAFIVLSTGAALALYVFRSHAIDSNTAASMASREGIIILNNLFLITACATVLLGTLYPLMSEWIHGNKVSVGPPYFNYTFIPLMILPLLLLGIAPFAAWKQMAWRSVYRQCKPAFLATIAACILIFSVTHTKALYAVAGLGLAAWIILSSITILIRRQSMAQLSMCVAHIGVGLFVAGIVGVGLWKTSLEQWISPDQSVNIGNYQLAYEKQFSVKMHNYSTDVSVFTLNENKQVIDRLYPEYRHYGIRDVYTSEAAIHSYLGGDIYTVIGESADNGRSTAIKIYHIPMIHLIWLGFMLMALGGIIAILQQRKYSSGSP